MSTFKFKNKLALVAVGTALSALPMAAMATNGYFAHGYGITSKGMAGAGSAITSNAMSGATNPAALAKAGNRFDFGVEYFVPDRTAVTRSDGVSYDGNGDSSFLIPEFAWNMDIDATKTFGVVVYGNGGMNTNYKSIPQYAGGSGFRTGVNLEQLFIAPTFTFKINPKHSIGVSLNLVYQTFEATGLGGFCGFKAVCTDPSGVAASARVGLTDQGKDSSTGYSLKVGWTGELTSSLNMAFAYQMKTDMKAFSKYNQLFAEGGDFDIPSNWTLGFAFQATPDLNLLLDVQRINYTDVASISNPNGSGAGTGALGASNGRGFGWDDMTVLKLGAEFNVNSDLVLRAGYSTADQPIPNKETAFNLIAPAVIEEHYTVGMTYTLANKSELSAFVMYAPEVTVNGTTTTPGTAGAANISMGQTSFGVGYGWNY